MSKKLIFFDIDGTLLNDGKILPDSTKLAINKLKKHGHKVAIATGRAPFMYKQLRDILNINNYISFNGQYIVLNNNVIYKNPINISELDNLLLHALENDHPIVYLDPEGMRANYDNHPHVLQSMNELKVIPPSYDPDFYKTRDIYQALIYCQDKEEEQYVAKYSSLHFIRWHEFSVDVIPAGGSKAVGLKIMSEHLGIDQKDIIAFGDGLNDIEMLEYAGVGVAMGNGHSLAKAAADMITNSVDENGIDIGLRKLGLI